MGLAKQVLASLYKRNIHRLTKTFLTLSLVDVANRAKLEGVEQAESYIIDMVCYNFLKFFVKISNSFTNISHLRKERSPWAGIFQEVRGVHDFWG